MSNNNTVIGSIASADEEQLKQIAAQLRKPYGEMGKNVATMMNSGNELMNRRTISSLNISMNNRILEIGMGNGFFVKDILSAGSGVKYTGCDYSEVMVEEAKVLNKEFAENKRAEFFTGNAENLPFENESFDKIFTVNTIYFWENPEAVLNEFYRVLKPGGLLIISIRPKWSMEKIPFVKYGFRMYSNEEVSSLLSANGFTFLSADEEIEPEQELNGEKLIRASVIISGVKK